MKQELNRGSKDSQLRKQIAVNVTERAEIQNEAQNRKGPGHESEHMMAERATEKMGVMLKERHKLSERVHILRGTHCLRAVACLDRPRK